ncbi:MAG: hypothetical protein J0L75_09410 [Spirochaetes bacterium]|nr:hypothetical protein [Spirochaetota bacterium]
MQKIKHFLFAFLCAGLLPASLSALESSERVRVLIDDIEINRPEDKAYAEKAQAVLQAQLAKMGRYDLMTRESIKAKIKLNAKKDAGLDLTDKELAEASTLAGAKYMMRARLSDVKQQIITLDKLPLKNAEARITVRLIETETVTSIGVLRYRLTAKGSPLASWEGLMASTLAEFRSRLAYDLKSLMLIQADITAAKGGKIEISRGKNSGIAKLQRYRVYNNVPMKIENEYGEEAIENLRMIAGDMRIVKVGETNATGSMRRFTAAFTTNMTAIEWNVRNVHFGFALGLTTFGVNVASTTISGASINTGDSGNTNFYLQIDGTDQAAFAGSRIGIGNSRLSPFVHFDFGWGPGKVVLLGRINVVATSPLATVTFDPGLRFDLIETGAFNFSIGINGKIGYFGGRIGSIQFKAGDYLYNAMSPRGFGTGVALGSSIDVANFVFGGSAQATVGFNVADNSRLSLMVGYDLMPSITPNLTLNVPTTYGTTSKSVQISADVASMIMGGNTINMQGILFGLSYQFLF